MHPSALSACILPPMAMTGGAVLTTTLVVLILILATLCAFLFTKHLQNKNRAQLENDILNQTREEAELL